MQFSDNKSGLRLLFSGLLPLFVLAHFGHHLLTALPIPLLPMIRSDFALDYTQSGWVVSAFNLAYGIGQLPGGWLTDRIGPRLMITIGICGVALAGFLVGLSHIFMLMIFFLALMGLLGGGYHPAAPPMIFALVPPRRGRRRDSRPFSCGRGLVHRQSTPGQQDVERVNADRDPHEPEPYRAEPR